MANITSENNVALGVLKYLDAGLQSKALGFIPFYLIISHLKPATRIKLTSDQKYIMVLKAKVN